MTRGLGGESPENLSLFLKELNSGGNRKWLGAVGEMLAQLIVLRSASRKS
jgi:hypothetical protein